MTIRKPSLSILLSQSPVFALLIVTTVFTTASAQDVPLWQQGVFQWDGVGYSLPDAPNAIGDTPETESSSGTPGYTMPVSPQSFAATSAMPAVTTAGGGSPDTSQAIAPVGNDVVGAIVPTAAQVDLPSPELPSPELPSLEPYLDAPIVGSAAPGRITQQVASGMTVENAPLQREVVRWYQYPWRWMTQGWTNHAEFGLDGSDGNATTLAIQTGLELKRKADAYTLAVDLDYRQASNRGTITEDNARLNIDYDRLLGDSNWTLFGKFGVEYDEFKAFDLRLNINSGLGYYWIRNDRTTFITRFGAGASREIGAPIDDWTPEAVFGLEADHQLNSRNKLKGKIDYFPAWEDFSDYRLVTDLGWEILLNDTENFSLKLAVTDRYDSTPQGALANDVYYSALLLYKF